MTKDFESLPWEVEILQCRGTCNRENYCTGFYLHYTLGLLYTQILYDHAPELEHDAAWLQPQEGDVKILGRVDPLELFDDPRRQGPVQGGPTVFYSGNRLCVLVYPFLCNIS